MSNGLPHTTYRLPLGTPGWSRYTAFVCFRAKSTVLWTLSLRFWRPWRTLAQRPSQKTPKQPLKLFSALLTRFEPLPLYFRLHKSHACDKVCGMARKGAVHLISPPSENSLHRSGLAVCLRSLPPDSAAKPRTSPKVALQDFGIGKKFDKS